MNNLPEKKEGSLFDKIKDDALMGVVEGIIPKLAPFIGPAMEKLNEYFGNDEKIFIMKKIGDSVKVFVIDNKKGYYEIARHKIQEEGKDPEFQNVFKADPDGTVIAVQDTAEFVQNILSGEFTKKE